jgi:lipopolysaccharide export LptBFGC system permease protein LptF
MFCPGPKGRNTGIYYTFMGLASFSLPYLVSVMTKSLGEGPAINAMMGLLLGVAVICIVAMLYLVGQYKKMYGASPLK